MKLIIALLLFFNPFSFQREIQAQYMVQSGTPAFLPNFIKPESGCNWTGVAGQVFDENSEPVWGDLVWIFGSLENQIISVFAVSGGSNQMGPGGFEVTLADHLISDGADLYLQLLDVTGVPISGIVRLPIQTNCEQNLTLLNMVGMVLGYDIFIPQIRQNK